MKKNRYILSLTSVLLAASVIAGAGVATAADTSKDSPEFPAVTLSSDAEKDETVYVFAPADGGIRKILVSDWLKNPTDADTVSDISCLKDIIDVKADHAYTRDGDKVTWTANGDDIYFQGTTDKSLPVTVSMNYTLDGKAVRASEIAGRSGKVSVELGYTGNETYTAEINGRQEQIKVPFVAVSAVILDNSVFKNVQVENGKIINDGDRTVVLGLSLPGLAEALDVTDKIPSGVRITADATDFALTNTYTFVFSDILGTLNNAGEISDKIASAVPELRNSIRELTEGTSALYSGLQTLLEKIAPLASGAEQLSAGGTKVQKGASELDAAMEQLNRGAGELSEGLATVCRNNETLTGGAKQVFEQLLATADAQLAASGAKIPSLTIENYSEVLDGLAAQLEGYGMDTSAVVKLKAQLDSYNSFYTGLCAYTEGVAGAAAGAEKIAQGTAAAKQGTQALAAGTKELNNGISSVTAAVPALTEGITQLRDGAKALSEGVNSMSDKVTEKLTEIFGEDPSMMGQRLRAAFEASESYGTYTGVSDGTNGSVRFIWRTDAVR